MGWMRNSTVAVILAIIALVVIAFVVKTQFLKTEDKVPFLVKSKADPTYTTTLMLTPSEMGKEVYADAKAKDLVPARKLSITYPNGKTEEKILTAEEEEKLVTEQKIPLDKIVPVVEKK